MNINNENLQELCKNLMSVKATEVNAKMQRIELEDQIALLVATKVEGTDKEETGNYKISVTSGLTRTLDYKAYQEIEDGIPDGVKCVDLKPTINLKKLRALEMVDPSFTAHFITTKPKKATVKVEYIQKEL